MPQADVLIRGGTFFAMTDGSVPRAASIVVKDGKVAEIAASDASIDAGMTFDAKGMFVVPGFVDLHIHDEYFQDPDTVQHCLIRQGVTTAVAGNCGSGPMFREALENRQHPWLHLAYLAGNRVALREGAGHTDRYTPASAAELGLMKEKLRECLMDGAMGLSLGLEYAPGASYDEISALAAVVSEFPGAVVTVHIRFDDHRCVDAVREVIKLSRENGVRLQVSHLGSMTMGHTLECAEIINRAAVNGADVAFDCYPYDAFCATAGSAVYDGDLPARWNGKGHECLEAVSGRFKGNRLTPETFALMRRDEPLDLIAAYVMDQAEIETCIADPGCIVASDALCHKGGAHPRIAGTFPRALRTLRQHGYKWQDALRKMTVMPADRMGLRAGRLTEGSVADIVVFDPDNFRDMATFQEPFLPPAGLRLVLINGKTAFEDGKITRTPCGDFYRRGTRSG